MVIAILALILAGSVSGAVLLWVQDASFWGIVLGYVAGGWAGLGTGLPVLLAIRALACRRRSARGPVTGPARRGAVKRMAASPTYRRKAPEPPWR